MDNHKNRKYEEKKGEKEMNKLTIIGNLTNDPELRTTTTGVNVCGFTVAVNKKKTKNNPDPGADFFKVSAWQERADLCAKFLSKGKKVCVVGAVSVELYTGNDGQTRANLCIKFPDEIEFLSPKVSDAVSAPAAPTDEQTGFTQVETDELPF